MAVTREQLAVGLRLIAAETDTIAAGVAANLDRALATAEASVMEYAPNAPEAIRDSAVVRLAARLYDESGREARGGNPMALSGAAHLLSPWRGRTALHAMRRD